MSELGPWVAIGALFLTFIGYVINATSYVSRIELAGQRALDSAKDQFQKSLDDAKQLMTVTIEKEIQKESKARHDNNDRIQAQIGSIDNDFRRINDRINDMVHKEDLSAVENRLVIAINKIDGQLVSALDKLTLQIESLRAKS